MKLLPESNPGVGAEENSSPQFRRFKIPQYLCNVLLCMTLLRGFRKYTKAIFVLLPPGIDHRSCCKGLISGIKTMP